MSWVRPRDRLVRERSGFLLGPVAGKVQRLPGGDLLVIPGGGVAARGAVFFLARPVRLELATGIGIDAHYAADSAELHRLRALAPSLLAHPPGHWPGPDLFHPLRLEPSARVDHWGRGRLLRILGAGAVGSEALQGGGTGSGGQVLPCDAR